MTTKTLLEIRRLHGQGLSDTEIAKRLGLHVAWATIWRQNLGLKRNTRPGGRPRKLYFVWRERDDELVACGTARECAMKMGIKLGSFYSEVSRSRAGKRSYYKILVEGMNDDRSDEPAGTAGEGPDDPHGAVHRDRPAGVSAGRENAAGGH